MLPANQDFYTLRAETLNQANFIFMGMCLAASNLNRAIQAFAFENLNSEDEIRLFFEGYVGELVESYMKHESIDRDQALAKANQEARRAIGYTLRWYSNSPEMVEKKKPWLKIIS